MAYFDQFHVNPYGSDAVCAYLYLVVTIIAWWQSIERMHMEAQCARQLSPIFRRSIIQRPLVQFPRILALSFLLRGGWFFFHDSGMFPGTCQPVNIADDCDNVFFSAASRLAQFLFFLAFSLIVIFWTQWSVGYDNASGMEDLATAVASGRSDHARGQHSGGGRSGGGGRSDGGGGSGGDGDSSGRSRGCFTNCVLNCYCCPSTKRSARCTGGFLVLCVWLFLLQAAAVAIKLYDTANPSHAFDMNRLYRLYNYMLAVTYGILTLGMLCSGVWLQRLLSGQISAYQQWQDRHTYNSAHKPRRLPHPSDIGAGPAALQADQGRGHVPGPWQHRKGAAAHQQLAPRKQAGWDDEGLADMTRPATIVVSGDRSGGALAPARHDDQGASNSGDRGFGGEGGSSGGGKAVAPGGSRSQRKAQAAPRTTDVLRRALWHLTGIQVLCVLLFLMRALLFGMGPSLGIDDDTEFLYPWCWYPIPELVPALLVLASTAPPPRSCCRRGSRTASRTRGAHRRRGCCATWCFCCPCDCSGVASEERALADAALGTSHGHGGPTSPLLQDRRHGARELLLTDEVNKPALERLIRLVEEKDEDGDGRPKRDNNGAQRSDSASSFVSRAWSDESGDEAVGSQERLGIGDVDTLRLACRFNAIAASNAPPAVAVGAAASTTASRGASQPLAIGRAGTHARGSMSSGGSARSAVGGRVQGALHIQPAVGAFYGSSVNGRGNGGDDLSPFQAQHSGLFGSYVSNQSPDFGDRDFVEI